MKKTLSDRDKAWMQGFACAAGIVGYCDGEDAAQEILKQGGFSKKDLIEGGCEEIDIERIYGDKAKPRKRITAPKRARRI